VCSHHAIFQLTRYEKSSILVSPLLFAAALSLPPLLSAQDGEVLFTLSNFSGGLFFTNRAQDVDLRAGGSVSIAPGSPQPIGIWTYDGDERPLVANASTAWPVAGESGSITRFAISTATDGDAVYFAGKRDFLDSDTLFVSAGGELSVAAQVADFGEGTGRVAVRQIEAAGDRVLVNIHQGDDDVVYSAYQYWMDGAWSVLQDAGDGSLNRGATLSGNGQWVLMENAAVAQPGVSTRTAFDGVTGVGGFTFNAAGTRALTITNDGTVYGIGFLDTGRVLIAEDAAGNVRLVAGPEGELAGVPLTAPGLTLLDDGFMASDGIDVYVKVNAADSQSQHYLKIAPDDSAALVATFPLTLGGETWSFPAVEDVAHGAILFSADSSDFRSKGFIRVGGGFAPSSPVSLWAEVEVVNGWKRSGALGWIYDGDYPLIYSFDLESYIYVVPDGATLAGFYFYRYADGNWFYGIEDFGGWAYQLTGDSVGWVNLLGG